LLDSPEKHRRAAAWEAHLEDLLSAAGGVTGFGGEQNDQQKPGRS